MKIMIQKIFKDNYFYYLVSQKMEIRTLQQANSYLGHLCFAQIPLPFLIEITSLYRASKRNAYISAYIMLKLV